MLILLAVNTTRADAGVFTLMESLFNKKALANNDNSALNSQNMPLLQAFSVLDPKDALGGGDTTIIDSNALVADAGPLGTSLDLELPTSDQISVYVVRPGDSLSQIAEMFDVSVNTIRWANDIGRSDTLKEGQILVILPISGVRYTVKKGDTLASVARAFKGDKEEIAQFNDLDTDGELAVGEQIIIPHGEIVPAPSPIKNAGKKVIAGNNRVDSTGYFIRPIRGGLRTQGVHGYNGIDLASYYGAEIYSAASGMVIVAKEGGWNGGYGSYVVVRHNNGTQTLYAHLSEVMVSQGQEVVQGQVIGAMGSSGRSTGTHLHFEVRGSANPF